MPLPLRAVLAEDNLLVREGLCSLLAPSDRVEVCAACASLPELLEAADRHRPDVVLTDVRMPPGFSDEGVQAGGTTTGVPQEEPLADRLRPGEDGSVVSAPPSRKRIP